MSDQTHREGSFSIIYNNNFISIALLSCVQGALQTCKQHDWKIFTNLQPYPIIFTMSKQWDQNTSEREWLSWNEMKCCGWEDNRCDLLTIYIYMLLRFSKTLKFWSSKASWHLHFSLPSIILADLLGNRTLLKRVQRIMVCDLWMVDFDPLRVFVCFKVCCLWL